MSTLEAVLTIAGTLATAAAGLAGALKLLANAITAAMREGHGALRDSRAALEANTAALADNTATQARLLTQLKTLAPLLFLVLVPWLTLSGCASGPDPLIVRSLERNRQVWEEDRRADLDPELVKSRNNEFDAQLRYAKSK